MSIFPAREVRKILENRSSINLDDTHFVKKCITFERLIKEITAAINFNQYGLLIIDSVSHPINLKKAECEPDSLTEYFEAIELWKV